MKLKKLIPLAGITGIAAIAAPLVTSCAGRATEIIWEPGEQAPKIKPVEGRKYKFTTDPVENLNLITKANDDYFNDLKARSVLFSEDMVNYWANDEWAPLIESAGVKNISIKTKKVDAKEHLLTYSIKMEAKRTDVKGTINFDIDVKNVRFTMIPTTTEAGDIATSVMPLIAVFYESEDVLNDAYVDVWELLEEEINDLFLDDSWYVDFKIHYSDADTTNLYHITNNNVRAALVLNAISTSYGINLFELGLKMASTYLSEVEWEIPE